MRDAPLLLASTAEYSTDKCFLASQTRSNTARSPFSSRFYQDPRLQAQERSRAGRIRARAIIGPRAQITLCCSLGYMTLIEEDSRAFHLLKPMEVKKKKYCPFTSRQSQEQTLRSPCSVNEHDSGLSLLVSLATRRISALKSYAEIRSRYKYGQRQSCHLGELPSCIP